MQLKCRGKRQCIIRIYFKIKFAEVNCIVNKEVLYAQDYSAPSVKQY